MTTAQLTRPARRRADKRARRPKIRSQWYVAKTNPKTGPLPTQIVGETREAIRASCDGCNLAPWADGGCYAYNGNMVRAADGVRRSALPKDLHSVLGRTTRAAKYARFGGFGDPGRLELGILFGEFAQAEANDLGIIGYTHHWRELGPDSPLRFYFLASCETLEDAAEANELGWLVALAGPAGGIRGYLRCRNELQPEITCNTCGMCSVKKLAAAKLFGVTFEAHGIGARRLPLAPA